MVAGCEALLKHAQSSLTPDEIAQLAQAIAHSGEVLTLPGDLGRLADVPSTGGPASLSTLLCPLLLASSGIIVPKISATGSVAGAVDTLGLVRGFSTDLEPVAFLRAIRYCGIAHIQQTESFCPADAILVSLRRKHSLMRHPVLAAVSLLAKKVAVPGTTAVFDFRIGSTGNIADDFDGGREVAQLFYQVAKRLNVSCAIALTDNRSFPCSALGRLESIALAWGLLSGRAPRTAIDEKHLRCCIDIAAMCISLVFGKESDGKTVQALGARLNDGSVMKTLIRHIEAQGASEAGLTEVLSARANAQVLTLNALTAGYWQPPAIEKAKNWIKQEQRQRDEAVNAIKENRANDQVGLRLLASPGEWVTKDQPLIEVRLPRGARIDVPANMLRGRTTMDAIALIQQPMVRVQPEL